VRTWGVGSSDNEGCRCTAINLIVSLTLRACYSLGSTKCSRDKTINVLAYINLQLVERMFFLQNASLISGSGVNFLLVSMVQSLWTQGKGKQLHKQGLSIGHDVGKNYGWAIMNSHRNTNLCLRPVQPTFFFVFPLSLLCSDLFPLLFSHSPWEHHLFQEPLWYAPSLGSLCNCLQFLRSPSMLVCEILSLFFMPES
jgi:hypothetical protein